MKKRKRTMLTLLILLAVLLVGYVVIVKVQEAQQEKKEESETEPVSVVNLSDVTAFSYTDGTNILSFVKQEDVWVYEADTTLDLEESEIDSIAGTLGTVSALREIAEPDALSDYGLEPAMYTAEIQDAVGNTVTLYIGNDTDSGCYATTGDKEVVYVVSSSVASAMEWDVNELVHVEETEETTE